MKSCFELEKDREKCDNIVNKLLILIAYSFRLDMITVCFLCFKSVTYFACRLIVGKARC